MKKIKSIINLLITHKSYMIIILLLLVFLILSGILYYLYFKNNNKGINEEGHITIEQVKKEYNYVNKLLQHK